ncbi:MAG: NAD(P)/FAD-dependent oxidoreductase [Thermodesulfobacteriota bacterium]
MSDYTFDFLFVGTGILGSSGAYALSKKLEERGRRASIGVGDIDTEGEQSSTLKNAGGVRATWRNRANIELCKYSIDFYESIAEVIQFRELGYFWMHGGRSWEEIIENHQLYEEYGMPVELHPIDDIPAIIPLVDNLEGIDGPSVSRKAGLIDHYSLREFYRLEARKRGVRFFDRCYAEEIAVEGGRAKSLTAYDLKALSKDLKRLKEAVTRILEKDDAGDDLPRMTFKCGTLINTAGAWAPRVSELYGFKDEGIKPRRRQMVVLSCPDVDLSRYGMLIDTSDIYFHQEAANILAGYSNMDEPYGYNFEFNFGGMSEESPFVKHIWRTLWKRISGFEKVKFVRGWAGMYAETPDRSGYLGKVPGLDNVYECEAHTGRGLMISYGAGTALADLFVDGKVQRGAQTLRRPVQGKKIGTPL